MVFHFTCVESKCSAVEVACLAQNIRHSSTSQWRTQKTFTVVGFIQWHMVVICIWCALFVTSQSDVIFMFLKQRFGEAC